MGTGNCTYHKDKIEFEKYSISKFIEILKKREESILDRVIYFGSSDDIILFMTFLS